MVFCVNKVLGLWRKCVSCVRGGGLATVSGGLECAKQAQVFSVLLFMGVCVCCVLTLLLLVMMRSARICLHERERVFRTIIIIYRPHVRFMRRAILLGAPLEIPKRVQRWQEHTIFRISTCIVRIFYTFRRYTFTGSKALQRKRSGQSYRLHNDTNITLP